MLYALQSSLHDLTCTESYNGLLLGRGAGFAGVAFFFLNHFIHVKSIDILAD